jgi:hypothetical protein
MLNHVIQNKKTKLYLSTQAFVSWSTIELAHTFNSEESARDTIKEWGYSKIPDDWKIISVELKSHIYPHIPVFPNVIINSPDDDTITELSKVFDFTELMLDHYYFEPLVDQFVHDLWRFEDGDIQSIRNKIKELRTIFIKP